MNSRDILALRTIKYQIETKDVPISKVGAFITDCSLSKHPTIKPTSDNRNGTIEFSVVETLKSTDSFVIGFHIFVTDTNGTDTRVGCVYLKVTAQTELLESAENHYSFPIELDSDRTNDAIGRIDLQTVRLQRKKTLWIISQLSIPPEEMDALKSAYQDAHQKDTQLHASYVNSDGYQWKENSVHLPMLGRVPVADVISSLTTPPFIIDDRSFHMMSHTGWLLSRKTNDPANLVAHICLAATLAFPYSSDVNPITNEYEDSWNNPIYQSMLVGGSITGDCEDHALALLTIYRALARYAASKNSMTEAVRGVFDRYRAVFVVAELHTEGSHYVPHAFCALVDRRYLDQAIDGHDQKATFSPTVILECTQFVNPMATTICSHHNDDDDDNECNKNDCLDCDCAAPGLDHSYLKDILGDDFMCREPHSCFELGGINKSAEPHYRTMLSVFVLDAVSGDVQSFKPMPIDSDDPSATVSFQQFYACSTSIRLVSLRDTPLSKSVKRSIQRIFPPVAITSSMSDQAIVGFVQAVDTASYHFIAPEFAYEKNKDKLMEWAINNNISYTVDYVPVLPLDYYPRLVFVRVVD